CPSYMVTREEMHSTRGRARLLFEMLQGDTLRDGWRSDAVKEALDLCLACKGCKSECPTQVDMATYKAEFLSHYYAGRLRPITAYTLGWIYWWARLASRAPGPVNLSLQNPVSGRVAKRLAGVSQKRRIPTFATETFTRWMQQRRPGTGSPVLLWPDTFTNFFHPDIACAAVEVLEAAGFQVTIPNRPLCCGRPLYDYGFLGRARKLLTQIMDALEPQINAGVPLIGLEPSCVAVFRDELLALFPHDERAHRLSQQSFLLSEFLEQQEYKPPSLTGRAVIHGHCHHKAVMGMEAEMAILRRLGLDATVLDSGCCGMAGAFGFEREHYDVSVACGERVLLPAMRQVPEDTLIIADGFSCREQISQTIDRSPLHLAQVLRMALAAGQ
ncbi:MAG TPA: heterodisulfide reductase-related iron-sulfur binding cluster, partial [Chloroflexota bacterium]